MRRLLLILRTGTTAFFAMRYAISIATVLLIMIYGVLTEWQLVPLYTRLTSSWRLPPQSLLMLLYLLVALMGSLIWFLWVLRPADSINAQLQLRPIYRTTDSSGLPLFDGLVLLLLAASAAAAPAILVDPLLYDPAIFMALVLALPVSLDFWPGMRPRRIGARSGLSLHGIALQVSDDPTRAGDALAALLIYNDLDPNDPLYRGAELPEGFVVEIPPRT